MQDIAPDRVIVAVRRAIEQVGLSNA